MFDFAALKVDTSRPGFHAEKAFLRAEERIGRTLLIEYATYVDAHTRALGAGYLQYARERVRETAAFLLERLLADGRPGACVDMSIILGAFLERQGVWNYAVRGEVEIVFSPALQLPPFIMRSTDVPGHGLAPGHVWLCAPPFGIVDLTLTLQAYENGEERHLPPSVLESNPLVVPSGWRIARDGVQIEYQPTGITTLGTPLEEATGLCLSGKYPLELWTEFQREKRPPAGFESL